MISVSGSRQRIAGSSTLIILRPVRYRGGHAVAWAKINRASTLTVSYWVIDPVFVRGTAMVQSMSASRGAYPPQASDPTIADLGRAIARRWRWVVVPTAFACLASFAFVTVVTPRYTGESKLLLQTSDSYFTRPANDRNEQQPQIDEQAVASQVQVVMSRDLAREAIKRLDLVGNPEFDPESGGIGWIRQIATFLRLIKDPKDYRSEDRVVEKYYENLLVFPVGKSRIVAIEFRSRDAELAATAANTIAEVYLNLQEGAKKDQARNASTWLGSNIDQLRKRVADAEAKVEEFRSRTGLLAGSGTTTLSAQQLSDLSGQLAQARALRSEAQARAKLIREGIRDGRGFDIPDVANNELIRRLLEQRITLRTQLALEQRTLLPQHPRIKELNAQLTDLESQLRSASERIVRTLENDARIAGAKVEALEAAIEAQKKIVSVANENEVQLRALEREARIQREQLESYLGRYREASARDVDSGSAPDARIVSRAVTPQIPSFPKKLPIVALSTLATLLICVGCITASELLGSRPAETGSMLAYPMRRQGSVFPYADIEARDFAFEPSHPVRGPILEADATSSPVTDPSVEPDPAYDFADLVERLSRDRVADRGRRVLVGQVDHREDALRVAVGLALTLAKGASVVLVEADGDEASPVDAVLGLTDLAAGEASFSDVIQREPGTELHRIRPGTLMNEALTSAPESLEVALAALESTYDWVVCSLVGQEGHALTRMFSARVDAVVLASNLDPAHPDLVDAYEAAQAAGAKTVLIAREQMSELQEAA